MAKRAFNFNDEFFLRPKFSVKNLSHSRKVTFNAGKMIPITWWEGYPGDIFQVSTSAIVKTFALSAPMMHKEDLRIRLFKVPLEVITNYDDLERAFTGGEAGEHINFPMVECDTENMTTGSLYDYLDLPLPYDYNASTGQWYKIDESDIARKPDVSPFPFLAYHRIYNDFYRNEETETEVNNSLTGDNTQVGWNTPFANLDGQVTSDCDLVDYNGDFLYSLDTLHNVGWERDYFTAALKNSQRGDQVTLPATVLPAQNLPVQGKAVFTTDDPNDPFDESTVKLRYIDPQTGATGTGVMQGVVDDDGTIRNADLVFKGDSTGAAHVSIPRQELGAVGAIALRLAMNLQALLEKFNIAGYRLDEQDYALFGRSSRLGRHSSQMIGGCQIPISVSEVEQTSESGNTPLGHLGGKSQAAGSKNLGIITCRERCIIMAVASITPATGYSQGLARKWTRRQYTDYFIPELQTIGEQEIENQELYFDFYASGEGHAANQATWAYQARYSDLMYIPDGIAGDFRTSLSFWHKSRLFAKLPAFNDDFVKCHPTDRTFAVGDDVTDQHYLGWFYFKVRAVRPMAKHVTSKLW